LKNDYVVMREIYTLFVKKLQKHSLAVLFLLSNSLSPQPVFNHHVHGCQGRIIAHLLSVRRQVAVAKRNPAAPSTLKGEYHGSQET